MPIFVNGDEVQLSKRFPDGTFAFHVDTPKPSCKHTTVTWRYAGEHEMPALLYIVNHLNEHGCEDINLDLPYLPNARMDRVKNDYEVFTLKYFCRFINSLGFKRVTLFDPHSSAGVAMLDRVKVHQPYAAISAAISDIGSSDPAIFFPDEGSMKRYSSAFTQPCAFGIKQREWSTGNINGLRVIGEELIYDRDVLIIDDICCKGGTFFHSAKALKVMGANDIFLYCSHCEPTIYDGELLKADFVKHIYTTNSIFSREHEKITVFDWGVGICD